MWKKIVEVVQPLFSIFDRIIAVTGMGSAVGIVTNALVVGVSNPESMVVDMAFAGGLAMFSLLCLCDVVVAKVAEKLKE